MTQNFTSSPRPPQRSGSSPSEPGTITVAQRPPRPFRFGLDRSDPLLSGLSLAVIALAAAHVWFPVALFGGVGIFSFIILLIISTFGGLLLHWPSMVFGNYNFAWLPTGYVSGLGSIPILYYDVPQQQIAAAVAASLLALVYNEINRLAVNHRRNALVDQSVYFSSAAMFGLVAVLSVIGIQFGLIGLKLPSAESVGPFATESNWWLPVFLVLLTAVVLTLLLTPVLTKQTKRADRFKPGQPHTVRHNISVVKQLMGNKQQQ